MPEHALNRAVFIQRRALSVPAHIYFTLDFREIVEGDLRSGAVCHLRYDPLRMPVPEGYCFGSPDEPVVAHVQFEEGGEVHEFPLHSKTGILRHLDTDITGHGTTLDGSFFVPSSAEELIVWFSHRRGGEVAYDSRYGANYEFRFVYGELRLLSATLSLSASGATNMLRVSVAADPVAEAVEIIYHIAKDGVAGPEMQASLADTGERDGDDHVWSASLEVAFDRVVVLDLAYRVEKQIAIDDNNRHHYLVFPPQA